MTGNLKVHKKVETRRASAVEVLPNGELAVWDSIPDSQISYAVQQDEPDIIVDEDEWQRVEREGHNWKRTSPEAIKQRAKERDDVDEDEVNI